MSRSTQFIGLSDSADEFVSGLEVFGVGDDTTGMFDEKIPLGQWRDKNGFIYREVVQTEIWSSGPMIFTCLIKETRPTEFIFKWSEETIQNFYDS